VYTKAFVDTDKALHGGSSIDDSLSGTTGVTVLQKGDRLLVANVGDSRAIIASMVDGKLVYSPLSNDQTPYRKDERERLKKLVSCYTITYLRWWCCLLLPEPFTLASAPPLLFSSLY
jgi:hypothetical protein